MPVGPVLVAVGVLVMLEPKFSFISPLFSLSVYAISWLQSDTKHIDLGSPNRVPGLPRRVPVGELLLILAPKSYRVIVAAIRLGTSIYQLPFSLCIAKLQGLDTEPTLGMVVMVGVFVNDVPKSTLLIVVFLSPMNPIQL